MSQRFISNVALAVAGAVVVVSTQAFASRTTGWVSFAEGLAFVGLAVAGLIVLELRTERVVHSLRAVPADSADQDELQAAA